MGKRRREDTTKRCDCEELREKYKKLQQHKFWNSSSFKQPSSIYFGNTSPRELMSSLQITHSSPVKDADDVFDKMPKRRFDMSSRKRLFEESDNESGICSECSDSKQIDEEEEEEEVGSVVVSSGEINSDGINCSSSNDFYVKQNVKEEIDNVENESKGKWCWNVRLLLGLVVVLSIVGLVLFGLSLAVFWVHTTWKMGWSVVEDQEFLVPT